MDLVTTYRFFLKSICALVCSLLVTSPAVWASDQDRARAALQAGQVLPLKTVLERLEGTHPGQVLEVELEQDGGRWIYEVKLLEPGGRLAKLKLDARTAELLPSRSHTDKR